MRRSVVVLLVIPVLALLSLLSFVESSQPGPQQIAFLAEWGKQGAEPGNFDFPIGIVACNAADEFWVTDHYNNRVQKFDRDGKLLAHFAVLPNPGGIGIDRSGNIYVSHFYVSNKSKDRTGHRVSVYSPTGKLLRQWGKLGKGDGDFDHPGGIAVGNDDRVYVADQTNHRIQVFDSTGKFLSKWGQYGNEPGQFGGKDPANYRTGGPQFVALDAGGNVWTTEGANGRVQKFSPKGEPLLWWGDNQNKPGSFGGQFDEPKGKNRGPMQGPIALCLDKQNHVWVSAVSGRVQEFSPDGKYLRGLVEQQGSKPGRFLAPHGMAFDSAGCLYVVDAYNHRIQKFDVPR